MRLACSINDVALSRTRYAAPLHPKELTCLDAPRTDVMGQELPSFGVRAAGDLPAALLRHQLTSSISLGRHSLVKNGSSGL